MVSLALHLMLEVYIQIQVSFSFSTTFRTYHSFKFVAHEVIQSPLSNFVNQNPDYSNVIGIKFEPVPDGQVFAENGLLSFGGLPDSSWYSGSLAWIPTAQNDDLYLWWTVSIQSIQLGDTGIIGAPSITAIVDTGTTLILLEEGMFDYLYESIDGSSDEFGFWGIPCASVSSLPNLTFNINGNQFTLTPSQYMLSQAQVRTILND